MTEINIEYSSVDKFNKTWIELEENRWYLKKSDYCKEGYLFLKGEGNMIFEPNNEFFGPVISDVTNGSWMNPVCMQYKLVDVAEINFKVKK